MTILASITLASEHIFQVLAQYSWVLPQYLQILSQYLRVLSRWIHPKLPRITVTHLNFPSLVGKATEAMLESRPMEKAPIFGKSSQSFSFTSKSKTWSSEIASISSPLDPKISTFTFWSFCKEYKNSKFWPYLEFLVKNRSKIYIWVTLPLFHHFWCFWRFQLEMNHQPSNDQNCKIKINFYHELKLSFWHFCTFWPLKFTKATKFKDPKIAKSTV